MEWDGDYLASVDQTTILASRPSKVPEVALAFWIIKIAATTLGETGGDAVSISLNLGYVLSAVIFLGPPVVSEVRQPHVQHR